MKIVIYNPQMGRFLEDFVRELSKTYEVKQERYYDPQLINEWADVALFFTTDNNIKSATNPSEALLADNNNYTPWALGDMDLTGKKIIVMPIDIEVWYGHHHGVKWDVITDVVFCAPHIRRMVESELPASVKIHNIPLGVDTDKFSFVDKPIGKKIAWVCEKWPTKGIDYMLQIMALLPKDYELHTIGGWNDRYAWEQAYQEDFIKRHGIQFFDYAWVEDQNEWLADKDFILSTSKKEAFGYNIAEGMSKGLIPIIHHFYGAEDIWDINIWDTVDDATYIINMYSGDPTFPRIRFREYLQKRGYDLQSMIKRFEEVINA